MTGPRTAALTLLFVIAVSWWSVLQVSRRAIFNPVSAGAAVPCPKSRFSLDRQEDDWTAHYLGANPQRAALPQYVPFMQWQYLAHEAPAVALPPPLINRLDGAPNELHLRVSSPRQAPRMYLYGDERNPVLEATVDGAPIDAAKAYAGLKPGQKAYAFRMQRWGLCYFNVPAQGIELRDPAAGYRMEVVDQSYGIGGLPGAAPRPDSMIPFPLMMDSVGAEAVHFLKMLAESLAPIVLPDADGSQIRLGSLWERQPAVVVFLRHYG